MSRRRESRDDCSLSHPLRPASQWCVEDKTISSLSELRDGDSLFVRVCGPGAPLGVCTRVYVYSSCMSVWAIMFKFEILFMVRASYSLSQWFHTVSKAQGVRPHMT